MHARAYLLLEKEYLEYKEANIFGIFATPIKDNLLEWLAEVQGLKDSLWEGAVLQLSIKYPDEYNSVSPTVTFNTIPFHPNVDQNSGRPCIDFLDNPKEWNGKLTMSSILLALQVMLSNPELENAVNVEAAEMLKNNKSLYRQMVLQCVRTSQHLEDLDNVGEDCASLKYCLPSEASSQSHVRRITKISFEEYHRTWSEIATSKATEHFKAPLFEDPAFIGNYYGWKAKNVKGAGEWDEERYNAIVSQLVRKQKQQTVTEKLLEIRKMEQDDNLLYQTPPDVSGPLPKSQAVRKKRPLSKDKDPWEREVDNLVAWTSTLCAKELED